MAGTPLRRERLKQAEAAADVVKAELTAIRLAIIRAGLDPAKFGAAALAEPVQLDSYHQGLPLQLLRLASEGKSLEETRVMLGFTEAQEQQWADLYVDFREALLRVRAREEAFWQGQARHLAASGDRAGFQAVSALIERRYHSDSSKGDASQLIQVLVGARLDQPVRDED